MTQLNYNTSNKVNFITRPYCQILRTSSHVSLTLPSRSNWSHITREIDTSTAMCESDDSKFCMRASRFDYSLTYVDLRYISTKTCVSSVSYDCLSPPLLCPRPCSAARARSTGVSCSRRSSTARRRRRSPIPSRSTRWTTSGGY